MDKSRNEVLNTVAKDFVEHQTWFKRRVQEGIRAADNDDFATDEEIARLFEKLGGQTPQP